MWLLPHQRPETPLWWSCGPPEGSLSPGPWRCCAFCQGSKPLSARRALLAALRLLAALALRASLRLLLRFATFTRCARPSGQPAAVTSLRYVYSLRSPFGPACGCYFASLRLPGTRGEALMMQTDPGGALDQETKSTKCSRANKSALP